MSELHRLFDKLAEYGAWLFGVRRPSPFSSRDLYYEVTALQAPPTVEEFIAGLKREIDHWSAPDSLRDAFLAAVRLVYAQAYPAVPPPEDTFEYRELLRYIKETRLAGPFEKLHEQLAYSYWYFVSKVRISERGAFETTLIDIHPDPFAAIECLLFFAHDTENPAFAQYKAEVLFRASIANNVDVEKITYRSKKPTDIGGDPREASRVWLTGNPFKQFVEQRVRISIPEETRFEHMQIVAASGHGKTQALQYLIAKDIEVPRRSVVVIDSQGDLIRNISHLQIPLDRLVIIDPTDIEYPVSLNLFDVGMDRLNTYSPLERERALNGIIELYDFVLGSLLGAEMTSKQAVIFRYITRLMLHIPDATIHTLVDLMRPKATARYQADIAKLSGTARVFFEEEFNSGQFPKTKEEVLRRLFGILENQTFERMFSHPRNKVDIFTAMNDGKIILINTAKDLLKENGAQVFGRFFIALIAQAAQERASIRPEDRTPTHVYIDEAHDYFDDNIEIILAQARKYSVGLTVTHQFLGQLTPRLQASIASNTAVKLVGGLSAQDARVMAAQMRTTPDFLSDQPKGTFAAYIKGVSNRAISLVVPNRYMEGLPQRRDLGAVRAYMRERYSSGRVGGDQPVTAPAEDVVEAEFTEIVEEAPKPTRTTLKPRPTANLDDISIKPTDRL